MYVVVGDRIVFVLPDDASDDDRDAAAALGAHEILTRTQLHELVSESAHKERSGETSSDFVSRLTPAEKRILGELAYRPDTRSRLATRLGVTTSTLDNQLAALKRKLLAHLVTLGSAPDDGYLSTEALIGWASRHMKE
jgi:predicted DNA binding protein